MREFYLYIALSFVLSSTIDSVHSQDFYLVLEEIVHRANDNYPEPVKFHADTNGGIIEFDITYYNNNKPVKERFKAEWNFHADMNVLALNDYEAKSFTYTLDSKRISGDAGTINPWRNPKITMSRDDGGWSWIAQGDLVNKYKFVKSFNVHSPFAYIYCRPDETVVGNPKRTTGPMEGNFLVKNSKNYADRYSYFFIDIVGNSNRGGIPEAGISYQVVYLYRITTDKPTDISTSDPCDIQKPDCSCCPGTMPVWNFETNTGECLCPEGKVWDRMSKKCK